MRAHLVALVAAALLPALAVGAIAVATAVGGHRTAFERRLESTAAALASAVGNEIEVYVAALAALGAGGSLDGDAPDLAAFHRHAQRVAADLGSRVFLIAPDGTMPLHTEYPIGTDMQARRPLRQASDVAARVFETGRPAVGDLLVGQFTGKPLTPIYVPVRREGRVVLAVGSVMESARLSRLLARQGFDDGTYAGLIDGQGTIVARSAEPGRYVGQRVRGWVVEGARRGADGSGGTLLRGANLAGAAVTTALRGVAQAPGWAVTVAAPDAAFRTSLRAPLAMLALGGAGALALALGCAAWIARRVLRPVDRLTREAEGIAASGGAATETTESSADAARPVPVREFERLRAGVARAQGALRERAEAVAAGEVRLRAVVDTALDAIVVTDAGGVIRSFNPAAEAIFGHAAPEAVGRSVALLLPHGADGHDHDAVGTPVGRHEAEGRRWDGAAVPLDVCVAEWRDAAGGRFRTWIMRDVSARKADEARRTLLAREVDHRAKNVLAVVQSMLRLGRRDEPAAAFATVEARVAALARVHSLLAEGGWSGADLRAVAERELAPYGTAPGRSAAASGPSVSLDGPPVRLAAAAVQPVAMVLHELATNAAKHGALSVPGGRVEVRWRLDRREEVLGLVWAEAGGPPVPAVPRRRGFGSRVVEATVRGQLGGAVDLAWRRHGLAVEIALPLARAIGGCGSRSELGATAAGAVAAFPVMADASA